MELKIDISEQPVTDAFNRLLQLGANPSSTLDAVGRSLITNIQSGFRNSVSPYGQKWEKPKHRSGSPLLDSGKLIVSIDYRLVGNAVEIGTNMRYAKLHQFGGTIKPKNRQALFFMLGDKKVFARQVTVPARPFMPTEGLPDSWRDDVAAVVMDVVDRLVRRESM